MKNNCLTCKYLVLSTTTLAAMRLVPNAEYPIKCNNSLLENNHKAVNEGWPGKVNYKWLEDRCPYHEPSTESLEPCL